MMKGITSAVINTADEMSWRLCLSFNCGRGGHYWVDCPEPLKDFLKQAKERSQPGNTREPGKAVKPERGCRREGSPRPPRLCRSVPIWQRPRTEHYPTDSLIILE